MQWLMEIIKAIFSFKKKEESAAPVSEKPTLPPVKKEPKPVKDAPKKEPVNEPKKEPEPIREEPQEEKMTEEKYSKAFMAILPLILKYEGGFVDDPADPGGATNKGVTFRVYDAYRKSKDLPTRSVKEIEDHEIEDIYYNRYWIKAKCDKIYPRLAIVHFDTAVNTGPKQAAKFLQRSCGAVDDGRIGPNTLKAVSSKKEFEMIPAYLDKRRDFYRTLAEKKPTLKKFLKGWLKRVEHLEKFVREHKDD